MEVLKELKLLRSDLRRLEAQQIEIAQTVNEIKSTQISLGHNVLDRETLEKELEVNLPITDIEQYHKINKKLEDSDALQKKMVS